MNTRTCLRVALVLAFAPTMVSAQSDGPVARQYKTVADRIIDGAAADSGAAWYKLARFTD